IRNSGVAFTGSVSSMTIVDNGNTTRTIDGLSFKSQGDWIVGKSTDDNNVILTAGDTADITAIGKAISIGQDADSNSNTLTIAGRVMANEIYIGSIDGNEGNTLHLEATAVFEAAAFRLAPGNFISIEDDYGDFSSLSTYLGETDLQVWTGMIWETVNAENHGALFAQNYDADVDQTLVRAIPEPATVFQLCLGVPLLFRRRSATKRSRAKSSER
ncbi:MAG: hypothetical protein ABI680_19410, partial [Chthoniobacteraceae bacterium]